MKRLIEFSEEEFDELLRCLRVIQAVTKQLGLVEVYHISSKLLEKLEIQKEKILEKEP